MVLYYPSQDSFDQEKKTDLSVHEKIPLEKIGQGAFSLTREGKESILPDMSIEILLIAKNLRPGFEGKKVNFLLSLKSSKEQYKAKNGEQIFLSCDPTVDGAIPIYHFSNKKTPLWIKPVSVDKDKVVLEVGLFFPSTENESFREERGQFILKEGESLKSLMQNLPFVEVLMKSKMWGQDVLLARFGGDRYSYLKDKVKLEIPGNNKTLFCFLGKGDCLEWGDAGWIPTNSRSFVEGKPLAQVKSITSKSIELEVFDSEGFCSYPVKIDMQALGRVGIKQENLPGSVRLRTSKQISCSFGKKRCLLKEGDWVLKTSRGWRNLKRAADIEDYLQHKMVGELFVFDSLEKDQGKFVMKGFQIDEMRMHAQPVSIPVCIEKQAHSSNRTEKKSSFLKKSSEAFITYFPSLDKENTEESR